MQAKAEQQPIRWNEALLSAILAIAFFHLAYYAPAFSLAIVGFLLCLFHLRKVSTARVAFYIGLGIGLCIYVPQLQFFYRIFGLGAAALWLVLAFWIGGVLLLGHLCTRHFSERTTTLLIPFIWTGLEYFRSELYYLRFSWLNVGFAFQTHCASVLGVLGVYGIGFACASLATALGRLNLKNRFGALGLVSLPLLVTEIAPPNPSPHSDSKEVPQIAGVQMEFPSETDVLKALDKMVRTHPKAKLLVLSEYTFAEALPQSIKEWCKANERFLIVGAQDPAGDSNYYNTAFVIGPTGEIVFRQAKSVPIQFFKDGLPAPSQRLWDSPWGRIGIAICYDLSYRRVMDELARLGAQALIIPTMDVVDWGEYQHRLHGRVAPVRAAEYGIPIYRVCSSGISQFTDARGDIRATAPFPGEGEIIAGPLTLARPARLPIDKWLAPFCVVVVAVTSVCLVISKFSIRTQKA